ncbi:uncharacterized protein [Choristoneura fumiferana]|uniref:uncharacterized protein n=1 Tax=Choristoneura fumiferana TaxID=7141 RepID=UPI003D15F016
MGLTKKFRSKKTDQETQSPVIKVFKEMMHRSENANNPEKVNLIKSKHERKTKRYTRSKAVADEKSDDTSATCTDRNYKVIQSQPPQSFSKIRSTIFPAAPAPAPTENASPQLQTDSKTSSKIKCMWRGSGASKTSISKDDTCSCMTCALKKLNKAQRNRLVCIGAILLITLIVAMYFILRPCPPKKCRDLTKTYEILARTLQPEAGDKRDRRSQYHLNGKGNVERQDWDESKSKLLSGLSDLYSADFSDGSMHEGNLHEANPPESSGSSALTDLSNVLDPNKISEGYSSNSLRNFYKKLIQTDMQIKNLKKSIRDIKSYDYTDFNLPRSKRSLKTITKINPKDVNPPESSGSSALTDLSNVLDPNKISEGYSSNSLRNFYKKLIQTDMQIKNLKKSIRDIKSYDYTDFNLPRSKRSLKTITKINPKDVGRIGRHDFRDFNIFFPPACAFRVTDPKVNKVKREFNYTNPSGIMIEKQKLVLEYQPRSKVPKCSHTPKDAKTKVHESEHKHPFFQHTERLDDILDRLLANPKVIPESIFSKIRTAQTSTYKNPSPAPTQPKCCPPQQSDLALLVKRIKHPHGSDYILSTENIFELKHQKVPQPSCISMPSPSGASTLRSKTTPSSTSRLRFFQEYEQRRHNDQIGTASEVDMMQEQLQKVKQQFNGVLSVSTLINGNKMSEEKKTAPQRAPSHRSLLQVDPSVRPGLPEEEAKEKTGIQRILGHRRLLQLNPGVLPGLLEQKPKEKGEIQQMPGHEKRLHLDSDLLPGLPEELEEKPEVWQMPGYRRLLQVDLEEELKDEAKAPRMPGHRQLLQHVEGSGEKIDVQRMPGSRRLLQIDLEEDRWEEDPASDEVKRARRMGQLQPLKQIKKNRVVDTHNPNWKDTMPLYPDELNAIIKQAAMQNFEKAMPMNSDNTVTKDMSDTEYVEDYANNKYDKLVKMAQAYSDYGVLDDKKEMRNDKNGKGLENRVKLSAQTGLGFFGRLKKSKSEKHYEIPEEVPVLIEREGIRFEFKPNPVTTANETTTKHISVSEHNDHVTETFQFGKHVKIAGEPHPNQFMQPPSQSHTPILKSFDFMTPAFKATSSRKPIKQTRVSERGLFFFGPHRRSLKSVDVEDEYDDGTTETYSVNGTRSVPNVTLKTEIPYNDNDDEYETDSEYSTVTSSYIEKSTDKQIETTTSNMTMSFEKPSSSNISSVTIEEIYEEITDWIMSLSGSKLKANLTNYTGKMSDIEKGMKSNTLLFMPFPPFPIFGREETRHKKRKLMSVEEDQNNITSASNDGREVEKRTEVSLATDSPAQATTVKLNKIDNASNIEANTAANDVANVDNKTVVKRSAPDTNLIFWNDIYDEEYGVKDPLDDSIRDKHSVMNSDIISKPRSWIGVKLRKIADKVRKSARSKQDKAVSVPVTVRNKVNKRSDKLFEEPSNKLNFVALTANMKKVCREAAKAVRETKSSEGRSRSEAASTLMQQLVGLMSDLVEIQVQQKTCVQLPPDLQKFLVWLTGSNPEDRESSQENPPDTPDSTTETYPPGGLPTEIFHEIPSPSPDLLASSTDVRTECLGTIHDVQRLITLYDGMSEEDKSKMIGVREYLENQLDFLHKQLSSFEGYYDPIMFHRIRRRRTPKHKKLRRMKRKIHRFIKNFGKKRTRSTVTYDAFETYTDSFSKTDDSDTNAIKDDKNKDDAKGEKGNDDVKRNLPDVYYRALAESGIQVLLRVRVLKVINKSLMYHRTTLQLMTIKKNNCLII